MKFRWSYICLIPLFFALTGCESIISAQKQNTIPTSVGFPPPREKLYASMLNRYHPGNRVGYLLFENQPLVHGAVPKSSERHVETITANALERQYAARPDVFVHTVNVKNMMDGWVWVPMTWTYYFVPVADGFDILHVIETKDEGLNEYYVAQQCFRMSGKTAKNWRRRIAETPVFSEYDLWAELKAKGLPKKSLSFIRRNNKWEEMPADEPRNSYRTSLGVKMDTARLTGHRLEPQIDCGLTTRTNLEGDWVCGLYWQRTTQITNHHPADCLHSFVNIGPLPPNSKRAIRGKIYWMKSSKGDMFNRWQSDWPK